MARKHNERFRGRDEITVFGRRAVLEALAAPTVEVEKVACARTSPREFVDELREACAAGGVEMQLRPETDIHRLSGDARNDQGVAARVRLTLVEDLERWSDALAPPGAGAAVRLLAFDGVTNPQNIGMVIRSALAAGISGVLWPLAGSPWINGLIIKASAGTIYRCPVVRAPTLVEGLTSLRRVGFGAFALESEGGVDLFAHEPPRRAVYVVGGETTGLSPEALALCERRLAIPMRGGVESLNAAIAASILCFHVARRGG
ncbi:MAG: RNA methyltransferase [Planctomycetota bacterium]|nr:RNA methyltransferase [Planctomycetota bacterium]